MTRAPERKSGRAPFPQGEWGKAARARAYQHVPGQKTRTDKMGLDATIPWRDYEGRLRTTEERMDFRRVKYPPNPLKDA